MLVWIALRRVKESFPNPYQLRRPVHVVCNDTMVENPKSLASNMTESNIPVSKNIIQIKRSNGNVIANKKLTSKN